MKSKYLILWISLIGVSCSRNNVTLEKDSPVYKTMSFADHYGMQCNQESMQEMNGKIIEISGYCSTESLMKSHEKREEVGKYYTKLTPAPSGAAGVGMMVIECYFNEDVKLPGYYALATLKGEIDNDGNFPKLRNCVVVEWK